MKQTIKQVITQSGMKVVFLFDKRYTTSALQLTFNLGWRHDPEDQIGLAHLFEHLIGKRTARFKEKGDFSKEKDKIGILSNATTSPDSTVYFHKQMNSRALESLGLLFEAIYFSNFNSEDLLKEKEVIMTEARQHKDNDSATSWHNAAKNLYPKSSLSKFFFGDEFSLKNVSLETFENFYQFYKNPKNAVLFIAINSSKNKTRFLKFIDNFFENYSDKTANVLPQINESFATIIPKSELIKEGKMQASVCIAFRSESLNLKDIVTFDLLKKILTGGLTGKLILKLRDELNLIYGISLSYINYPDTSMIFFQTNCKKEQANFLITSLESEMGKTFVQLNELDIKNVIESIIYQTEEKVSAYNDMYFASKIFLSNNTFVTTEEYMDILKKISIIDIKNLYKKIFNENKTVFILK